MIRNQSQCPYCNACVIAYEWDDDKIVFNRMPLDGFWMRDYGPLVAWTRLGIRHVVDPIYRDLAIVLWGLHALDTVDPQTIVDRLTVVSGPDNPWHASATEVMAVVHLKTGDRAAARADYQKIADDLMAPRGLRARAAQMVAALES